jgi:hypothetical protein
MKTIRIDYKDENACHSVGGHKWPNQSGLVLSKSASIYTIEGINPKTNDITTRIKLQFPHEEIDNIIQALQQLKNI